MYVPLVGPTTALMARDTRRHANNTWRHRIGWLGAYVIQRGGTRNAEIMDVGPEGRAGLGLGLGMKGVEAEMGGLGKDFRDTGPHMSAMEAEG